ncbi:hypothetical protein MKW92_027230 [Papaver armeniacum]|nr:hypothetical protein MKW92_027230 [Papaver armeniacum]
MIIHRFLLVDLCFHCRPIYGGQEMRRTAQRERRSLLTGKEREQILEKRPMAGTGAADLNLHRNPKLTQHFRTQPEICKWFIIM